MNLFHMAILFILFHGTIGAMNLPGVEDTDTKEKIFVIKRKRNCAEVECLGRYTVHTDEQGKKFVIIDETRVDATGASETLPLIIS